MNKVIMIGRLTKSPDYKEISSQNGTFRVANFDIAVRRNSSATTDFFHVKAFNNLADTARDYLRKGTKVLIEGELQTSSYPDKDTGEKKIYYGINAARIEFIESKSGVGSSDTAGGYPPPVPDGYDEFMNIPDGIDEDLPFK